VLGVGWWTGNKDMLAFVVSLVALCLSLWATRVSLRKNSEMAEISLTRAESMARVVTYQRLHEMLVDPQAAGGRRKLFVAHAAKAFPLPGESTWDEINYALALYDTLGGYLSHGQVDEQIVLAAWHHPLVNIIEPTAAFVDHRRAHGVDQPWTYLHQLLEAAKAYECRCEHSDTLPRR
jgi:hypothetical protein